MANENSAIDSNRRHTLLGVTDNVAAELRRLLVDPVTGALKCTATLSLSGLTVAQGGTGLTSLTAYAVLCGGTTATGAMQQVSGVGNANDVLTSNGAGALPTWQAPSGAGANAALSNLVSVAINAALIPGTAGALDFGSTAKPWGAIWLAGTSATPGTNQFKITGASTSGLRTITLPNNSGTVALTSDIKGAVAKKAYNDVTSSNATPSTATVIDYTIPAGSLSTTGGFRLRFKLYMNATIVSGNPHAVFTASFGGSTLKTLDLTSASNVVTFFEIISLNNASASAQATYWKQTFTSSTSADDVNLSVDTASAQNVTLTISATGTAGGSSAEVTVSDVTLELL